jgi:uncharacterized protein YqjF (DUF2071 family)
VPRELEIDQFEGTSWVGVVPFRMEGVSRRPFPDIPGLSAFPELNLRLYVTRDRRPGVWFLSLDATSAIAVWAARTFFHLPYHHAAIDIRPSGTGFRYRAERFGARETIRLDADYAPAGPPSASCVRLRRPPQRAHKESSRRSGTKPRSTRRREVAR